MKTQHSTFSSRPFSVFLLFMMLTLGSFDAIAQTTDDNDYKKGLEAYSCKDYSTAVEYFTKAANQGNSKAQYWLGNCYSRGDGVSKDEEKSSYWYKNALLGYEKAANRGDSEAQYWLGNCYSKGKGVSKDEEKSSYWYKNALLGYEEAANRGDSEAQYWLGDCYSNGWCNLVENKTKALFWYTEAANRGHVEAQVMLGGAYTNCWLGLEKNHDKAFFWYTKAANQGNPKAQENLGYCFQHGLGVAEDSNKASYWLKSAALGFEKLANEGSKNAMFSIALCYQYGEGVVEDYNKAIYWYTKHGGSTSLKCIAEMKAEMNKNIATTSFGSSSNSAGTTSTTTTPATTISAEAHYKKALEYMKTGDFALATPDLHRAIKLGHTNAMVSLGDCLRSVAQQDYQYALNMAMMSGNMDGAQMAQVQLTQAIQVAIGYYQQAADLGNSYGQQRLSQIMAENAITNYQSNPYSGNRSSSVAAEKTCSACRGTGKSAMTLPDAPGFGVGNSNECLKRDANGNWIADCDRCSTRKCHSHQPCTVCSGTGMR